MWNSDALVDRLNEVWYRSGRNQVLIARAKAILPLVELVRDGNANGKSNAAGALWNLAGNADNKRAIAQLGAIPFLVALLRSGNAKGKANAAGVFTDLAVNADIGLTIAQMGAISPLVALLMSGEANGNVFLDWKDDDISQEFTFLNPKTKGLCGCGESFNV